MAAPFIATVQAADRQELDLLQQSIRARKGLLACGDEYAAAVTAGGRVLFAGSNVYGQEQATAWQDILAVCGSRDYLLGLTGDGSVHFAGRDTHGIRAGVAHWSRVDMVACSTTHAAALLIGGRVLCAGELSDRCTDTSEWSDVRDICCGRDFTLGLTAAGEVLIAGGSYALREHIATWGTVVGLFSDVQGNAAYAVTADGRLVSTRPLPYWARKWSNLVFVAASDGCIRALTAEGQLRTGNRTGSAPGGAGYISLAVGASGLLALDRQGNVTLPETRTRRRCLSGGTRDGVDTGWSDLFDWTPLFGQFEDFSADRRAQRAEIQRAGQAYLLRLTQATRYGRRLACGARLTACIAADGHVLITGGLSEPGTWRDIVALSCGASHVLALCRDGHVQADGNDTEGCCRTDAWENVVYVQAFRTHSLGLRADGRVLYAGAPDAETGRVADWAHIRLLRGSDTLTLGVAQDGSICFCGKHPALDAARRRADSDRLPSDAGALFAGWDALQDVVISEHIIAGLRADGTVAAMSEDGSVEPAVSGWRDIRAIAAGCTHLVGLEFGGRVVAAGEDPRGQCGVSGWRQIVAVSCGDACTVGLCADGTAVAAGQVYVGSVSPDNPDGWVGCAIGGWSHLLAVCCGHNHIAAMTDSGQILTCGQDADGQCRGAVSFAAFRDLRQYDGYTIFDNAAGEESRNSVSKPPERRRTDTRTAFSEAYGWFSYASFLRDEAERLASCLQTDATALTLLTPEGTFRWLYDARRLVREENGVIRRAESGENDLVLLSLSANGRLTATGDNQEGQCDTEDWAQIVAASTSGTHTVGLRADGHVLATGRNASGECDVGGWRRVLQVVALPDVTLGLCADGRILHTGKRGRILDALRGVRAMTGAKNRVVFVLSDGSLRVHLRGSEFSPEAVEGVRLFRAGVGHSLLTRWNPRMDQAAGARQVRRLLGCGIAHAVRVLPRGRVSAVGANDFEQCGVTHLRNVTAVSCGLNHTAAVTNGAVYAVGLNRDGQCSCAALNAALMSVPDGQPRTGAACYLAVACGYSHTVALRGDGRVFAIGASPDGRCDTAAWHDVVDIACGVRHTAAVLSDGHCVATGDNSRGQCAVGDWENVVMIACGEFHTAGVTADGRVLVAGNAGGEACRVENLRDVISVACLPEVTVCVHADGHMTVRGGDGMLAEAVAPIRDAVAVDGKEYRLAVLTVDRRVLFLPGTE